MSGKDKFVLNLNNLRTPVRRSKRLNVIIKLELWSPYLLPFIQLFKLTYISFFIIF